MNEATKFIDKDNLEIFDSLCIIKTKVSNSIFIFAEKSCYAERDEKFFRAELQKIESSDNSLLARFDWENIFSNDNWKSVLENAFLIKENQPSFCSDELQVIQKHFREKISYFNN